MASDYLIPCSLGLVRESLRDWCGPVVLDGPTWSNTVLLGPAPPRHSRAGAVIPCLWVTGKAFDWSAPQRVAPSSLYLDLDRPEVCDHLARVVGLRDATLTWGFATWHTQDHEQRQQIRDDTLHLLRLVDIARAVGLDPQPGERLTLERCTGTQPGHDRTHARLYRRTKKKKGGRALPRRTR